MNIFYAIAADALLLAHVLVVAFIVLGQAAIVLGKWRGWHWVRNPGFRWGHLAAIGVVVAQAWLGVVCPLTTWEMALREKAGDAVYAGSFIAHWLEQLLYYRAAPWVFITLYSSFGLVVLWSWFWVKPRSFN